MDLRKSVEGSDLEGAKQTLIIEFQSPALSQQLFLMRQLDGAGYA